MAQGYLKCRYCDFRTLRFRGKTPGARSLEAHVVSAHQREFLAAVHAQSFDEYLDRIEAEDDWIDEMHHA